MECIDFFGVKSFNAYMSITKEKIGGRIKNALKAAGITQRAISKSLGVGESAVSAYVQGAAEPSANGLFVIAQTCKTTTDWLITGKGSGPGEADGKVNETQTDYSKQDTGLSKTSTAVMRAVIEGIEEYLEEEDLELRPAKKADLVLTLFEMCMEEGKEVDKATIIRLVRLAV